MGFSGGGSNVLLPHTHDGTVSQDGGPLDFGNVTQSQSAAGQVFYSDGNHLQQLSIGAASDELRVNAGATAPEWYTPGSGTSPRYVLLGNDTLGSDQTNVNLSFVSQSFADVSSIEVFYAGRVDTAATNCRIRINGLTGNVYHTEQMLVTGGVISGSASGPQSGVLTQQTSRTIAGHMTIQCLDPTNVNSVWLTYTGTQSATSAGTSLWSYAGYIDTANITAVDEVDIAATAGNLNEGFLFSAYKVTRT